MLCGHVLRLDLAGALVRRLLMGLALCAAVGFMLASGTAQASALTGARIRPLPSQVGGLTSAGHYRFSVANGPLVRAEVLVVSMLQLPAGMAARIGGLPGVTATATANAGRVELNGVFANVIGVNAPLPSALLGAPAAKPAGVWRRVSAGGVVVSRKLARHDELAAGESLHVAGSTTVLLPVAGSADFGIAGVDAIVSAATAQRIGIPAGNVIIVGAQNIGVTVLMGAIQHVAPSAAVVPLVAPLSARPESESTSPGSAEQGDPGAHGRTMSPTQVRAFLGAAKSRVGMPYVWGGDGPDKFDCSGLVKWSMAQAGIVMPRVASDQALTGPIVSLSQLQPGDLLFYHDDPDAPRLISHVAIYLGNGRMLQAPAPGMDVEIVSADFGLGFAIAVRVNPELAAQIAGGN
jgi:peptidoglycan DL-endopeptidase CwlO